MYDEALADRVRARLAGGPPFTEQKMFGGLAFLIGGNMALGVMRDELMVRTGREGHRAALEQPGARPMDFTGRPMTGMVIVSAQHLGERELDAWVAMGAGYAGALPPKSGGRTPQRKPQTSLRRARR